VDTPPHSLSSSLLKIQYKYIDKPHLIYPIYFKSQNNQITIVLSDLSIHTFIVTDFNKKYSIDNISDVILNETIDDLYRKQMYNNIRTLVIYKQNSIIKGGYCDGTIKHFYKGDGKLTYNTINLEHNNSPITAIALTSNQKTIIFGTQKGALMIYAIPPMKNNDQLSLSKLKVINDHSDEIIEITLNENLQIIATSSYDEYIFIYTIPTYKCIRSFKFPNFYADNIIISSNPLPVIVLYCEECSEYKLFTLNGSVIDINDTYITNQGIDLSDEIKHKVITCFGMYTDSKYVDHLIMGTDDGCVIIREFPTLKVEVFVKVFDEDTSNVTVKYVLPILNGNGVLVYGNNKKTFKLITNKL
jgi:WD40 repeat protein